VAEGRAARFTAFVGEATHAIEIEGLGEGTWRVSIDGRVRIVDSRQTGPGTFSLLIDHATADVSVLARGDDFAVSVGGRTHRLKLLDERKLRRRKREGQSKGERDVRAAMPGKVVAVLVETGATVTPGQALLVVEAMKMENEITAPRAGAVVEVRVKPGQAVEAGEILVRIE
jgi:biotin carboxyl carrier protein